MEMLDLAEVGFLIVVVIIGIGGMLKVIFKK
jgi:hypothetical protein